MQADGSEIRRRREKAGIRLRTLAAAAGLSPAHLSRIERGERAPSTQALAQIADALGCEAADIDTGADEMSETGTASPYLTTEELAAITRRTPDAVRQMRHRGTGPKGVRVGRRVLYPRDAVTAWLRALEEADDLAQRAAA